MYQKRGSGHFHDVHNGRFLNVSVYWNSLFLEPVFTFTWSSLATLALSLDHCLVLFFLAHMVLCFDLCCHEITSGSSNCWWFPQTKIWRARCPRRPLIGTSTSRHVHWVILPRDVLPYRTALSKPGSAIINSSHLPVVLAGAVAILTLGCVVVPSLRTIWGVATSARTRPRMTVRPIKGLQRRGCQCITFHSVGISKPLLVAVIAVTGR